MHSLRFILVYVVMLLAACGGCEEADPVPDAGMDVGEDFDATPDAATDAADSPDAADAGDAAQVAVDWFDVWREMRSALREDPSYLRYERDRLVEAGDPAAMHLFVRDELRTIPTGWNGWGGPNVLLYGTRGMLRYGAGSMRDKAELLREMLVDAGFEAEVRQLGGTPDDFTERVLRPRENREVSVDPVLVDRWTDESGLELGSLAPLVDPDGAAAGALADELVQQLPADAAVGFAFAADPPGQIPIVRFRATPDDEWTMANLFLDGVSLGDLPFESTPASAFNAVGLPPAAVQLRLHTVTSPPEGILLVEGEVPVNELAGRQLRVGSMPAGELRDNLMLPLDSFSSFVPMIALQGIDAADETRETYSFIGDTFTLRGDRLTVDTDTNTVTLNGTPLNADMDYDVSAVDGVRAESDGRNFPEVLLRVEATAGGSSVEELPASAFRVTDRGEPVAPLVVRNVDRPRVIFLIDESGSLPAEFLTDQLAPIVVDIADSVLAGSPLAEFQIFKVGTFSFQSEWTQDLAQLEQEVSTYEYGSSNIWQALGTSASAGATACVMITDGEATDSLTPGIATQLEASPPCVFLRAGGDPAEMDLEEMADIVGGVVFDVSDQAVAQMHILDFLDQDDEPYLLRYLSVNREAGEHPVTVEVGPTAGSTSYVAPAAPAGSSSITGLELRITSQPQRPTVNRMLFGSRDGESLAFEDAQRGLLAGHLIGFEGESPIVHEVIDETLENRLQLERLTRAVAAEDEEGALAAFEQGARWMPSEILSVFGPALPPDGAVIYTDQLRAAMVSERLVSDRERVSSIDVLAGPGLGVRSATADGTASLRQSVEASVRSSLIEAELFETSTVSLLDGETLAYLLRPADLDTVLPGLSDAQVTAWQHALAPYDGDYHLVIPADGDPVAFYAINKASGATYGVLGDGSGGGTTAEMLQDQLDAINALLDWLSFGGAAMGASATFGFWIALQKAIAKQIITATIAIVEMTSPTDPSVLTDALNLACDLLRSLFADLLGAGWVGLVEAFIAAATGHAPITCFSP